MEPFLQQSGTLNDRDVENVRRRVDDFLYGQDGHGLDVGKAQHFERLITHVRYSLPDVDRLDNDEIRMVAAMCWLGPRSGVPPRLQRQELMQILRRFEPEIDLRSQRTMEFCIAYGCGKWRTVAAGSGDWEHRWAGAMQGLQRALEPAVMEADRWLRRRARVVGFPQRSRDDLGEDAWMLTLRLINVERPLRLEGEELSLRCTDDGATMETSAYGDCVPNGARAVFVVVDREANLELPDEDAQPLGPGARVIVSARDDETKFQVTTNHSDSKRSRLRLWQGGAISGPALLAFWTCTCGHLHCAERHRLEAWDASEVSLWSFVASAVKGPQPSIQLGSFVAGMYFPLLARDGFGLRLRTADVEYKVCQPCRTFAAEPETESGSQFQDLDTGELTVGDYVSHSRYGIGVLQGEVTMKVAHTERKYLCIQYAEGDKLYIPSEDAANLSRYTGHDEPGESRLGAVATLEYEGMTCPLESHPFDPTLSHRLTHERLIVVGDYAPHYEPQARIRCRNRSGHYQRITGQGAPANLTERWENLFHPVLPCTLNDILDAKRALADRPFLLEKVNDPPTYAPLLANVKKLDERSLRRGLKAWLAATLDTACPLCGNKPLKTRLTTVWQRTFAVVESIDRTGNTGWQPEADGNGQVELTGFAAEMQGVDPW